MGNFEARLEREWELRNHELWEAHGRGEHLDPVKDCAQCQRIAREVIREVLDKPTPEDWFEDDEGYVRAPLSYENREGDPTLNGALDKW